MSVKNQFSFDPETDDGIALLAWHSALERRKGNRAELRRCRGTTDLLLSQAFYSALRETGAEGRVDSIRFANVVGLLSHIRENNASSAFPVQMAMRGSSGKAIVSGLRFRRLLVNERDDQLYQSMIRMIRLLKRSANILSVAEGVYWWNDRTRRDWASAYYMNAHEEV